MNFSPLYGMNKLRYPYPMPIMPVSPELAHAYVPYQYYTRLYPPMVGLDKGTIFPGLDRPYGLDPEYTIDA